MKGLLTALLIGLAFLYSACSGGNTSDPGDAGDGVDADTDSDSDNDSDSDSDLDTDTDGEGDADTDTDSDADGDVDSDSDADADTDGDADTDTDADGGVGPDSLPWIMGYYVGYQSTTYPPEAIDFEHLTHIAMGAVLPNADGTLDTSFYLGSTSGPALAQNVAALAHAADVVPILMIGGAGTVTGFRGAASDGNRDAFVTNLIAALDDLGYDGLDLDWEPIAAGDEPQLLALAGELRAARPDIVLTMPVNWVNGNSPSIASFFATIEPSLDQINIMSYGMAGAWGGWQSWHSSALQGHGSATPSSVASSTEAYVAAGIPPHKLGVGAGFYGQCWAGGVTGPRQDLAGDWVAAVDSQMSYAIIMEDYYDGQAAEYDTNADAPYLGYDSPAGSHACTFISYEDEQSLAAKSTYINDNDLGGIIIWTINQGYISGAAEGERNPLLKTLADSLWAP